MAPLISDPRAVTILAPELAPLDALLDALGSARHRATCSARPRRRIAEEDDYSDYLDEDEFPYYSATVSDTVATFLIESSARIRARRRPATRCTWRTRGRARTGCGTGSRRRCWS